LYIIYKYDIVNLYYLCRCSMDQNARRKIFAGGRVRKLRNELGLSQSAMAGEIGISLSYLNLIERNQRPLTAQLLIRLSESYAIDARSFAQEEDIRAAVEMEEIFSDPIFQQAPIPRSEIGLLAEDAPEVSEAFKRLYRSYVEMREFQMSGADHSIKDERGEKPNAEDPIEQTRIFIERSGNYFPPLEKIAEDISSEMKAENGFLFETIVARLKSRHGIRVQIMPLENMRHLLRHYDRHRKKLMISELLDASGRTFQTAFHLGLLEANPELDNLSLKVGAQDSPSQKLARISLCNYFAAALMMPYAEFIEAASTNAYDLDILGARFSASFEQVAHRLTTLARPGKRGIPFFMIRVDAAGNVSKRFSSGSFPFSRFGGTCARWNIHSAFRNPGTVELDVIEMPEGTKWFSISRTVQRRATPWGDLGAQFVIGLGCDLKHAHQLIYSRGLDLKSPDTTPIGINCRLCERPDCAQRASPPLMRKLLINENTRGLSPFEIRK
jgi:XRE family transcriptional regulator, fatty acid utilization regulator